MQRTMIWPYDDQRSFLPVNFIFFVGMSMSRVVALGINKHLEQIYAQLLDVANVSIIKGTYRACAIGH